MKKGVRRKLLDITFIAAFVAIIAVCAMICVPLPATGISFTMQTFGVVLAVFCLGTAKGFAAVAVYILIGLIGLPIFSGFRGGFEVIVSPTGGYLAGFLPCALLTGFILGLFSKKGFAARMIAGASGLAVCYLFGTVWFCVMYAGGAGKVGFFSAVSMCVLPYVIPDLAKISLAALISLKVGHFFRKEKIAE